MKPPHAAIEPARSIVRALSMGCHQHDFAAALDAAFPDGEDAAPAALIGETEFEFLTRRALEEARLAQQARTAEAANAHRYLAAAYSEQLARHIEVHTELEDLLNALP